MHVFSQFIRFCAVGVINTTVNYTIYLSLLSFHVYYLLAGIVGYLISAVVGFTINRLWTFKIKVPHFYMFLYLLVNVFSMSVSILVQWFVVEKIHVKEEYSLFFAIIVTTFINYFLIKKLVFKHNTKK